MRRSIGSSIRFERSQHALRALPTDAGASQGLVPPWVPPSDPPPTRSALELVAHSGIIDNPVVPLLPLRRFACLFLYKNERCSTRRLLHPCRIATRSAP
mgnify:CR=1 FL=1